MEPNRTPDPQYLPAPFTPTVVLNDGAELKAYGSLDTTTNELWIWTNEEMDFVTAVMLFSDAEKTSHIVINSSPLDTDEYDGYTRLNTIKTDSSNRISVRLTK